MRNLLVVDDDEISREILTVFASEAGYSVTVAVSGDAALAALGRMPRSLPDVILADVQMAGTAGESLAECLRLTCGTSRGSGPGSATGSMPKLIAMSACGASPRGFDSFIRKPFTLEEFQTAVGGIAATAGPAASPVDNAASLPVLDETVYRTLKRSLPDKDLSALYTLCLEDTARRIERMQYARKAGLGDLYVREAHAIRGSCGFVGAGKLSHLAAELELHGLVCGTGTDPLDVLTGERESLRLTLAALHGSGALTHTKKHQLPVHDSL